jgi:chitosanase
MPSLRFGTKGNENFPQRPELDPIPGIIYEEIRLKQRNDKIVSQVILSQIIYFLSLARQYRQIAQYCRFAFISGYFYNIQAKKGGLTLMRKYPGVICLLIVLLSFIIAITGCSSRSSTQTDDDASLSLPSLTSVQKRACLQMTTFCENDPYTTLQYNFAKNIGDGAGITFGCIGFTTGTYSGNILIKYYTTLNPDNVLAQYIPALDLIDSQVRASGTKSDDLTGLDGFIAAVQNCTDPLFKTAQKYELDQMFWSPAVAKAAAIGAKYPITVAFIYDMCVNHGQDGTKLYIDKTNAAMGGTPATGINERKWLEKCINIRLNASATNKYRCNAFQNVLNTGNVNLITPFSFTCYGDTCTIDGNVGY